MSLPRERATEKADLPHAYEQLTGTRLCHVCGAGEVDARHGEWEKAREEQSPVPVLPRETGV